MLIKTTATEKSHFPIQNQLSDLIWRRKKNDCAGGKARFFVGQWSAKAVLSRQMQSIAFALLIAI
jgi:hypothetical protein